MKIENLRYTQKHGYPLIAATIDGIDSLIPYEQKVIDYGFLFLGAQFEDVLPPVVLPANPSDGRPKEQELHGFTDDPDLLAIYERFKASIDEGTFKVGKIKE